MFRVAKELVAWLCARRRWYRVRGNSMYPTLKADDCVLVDTRARSAKPDIGRIVVVHDPERSDAWLVKRVASHGDNTFALQSDNPADARDSRQFGSLELDALIGPATVLFTPDGKLRWLPDHPTLKHTSDS